MEESSSCHESELPLVNVQRSEETAAIQFASITPPE